MSRKIDIIDLTKLKPNSDNSPLVSVIVPSYNVEGYIDQCLTSILNNGYQNIELLVIDDRSTDGTVDHIKALMKKDKRIQLFYNPEDHNIYGGACRNIGLDHAKGKYVYFCDSDDYILPGLIPECVRKCEQLNADICCFRHKRVFLEQGTENVPETALNFEYLEPNVQVFNKDTAKNIFLCTYPEVWDKIYNRDLIKTNHIRFQEMKNTNDVLFHTISMLSAARIAYIDKVFYVYRVGTKTSVQKSLLNGKDSYQCWLMALRETFQYVQSLHDNELIYKYIQRIIVQVKYRMDRYDFPIDEFLRLKQFLIDFGIYQLELRSMIDQKILQLMDENRLKTRVLYFDSVPWHEEVCYGVVDYLKEIGCQVDVILNDTYAGKGVEKILPSGVNVSYCSRFKVHELAHKNADKYDFVICGTFGGDESSTQLSKMINPYEVFRRKTVIGISHHYLALPKCLSELVPKERTLSLINLGKSSCDFIQLSGFGENIKGNLTRGFGNKVFFASRGSKESIKFINGFVEFIQSNEGFQGYMTKPKTYDFPVAKQLENLHVYENLEFMDMVNIANKCNFIYMPISAGKDGKVDHASGSFQLSLALGLIPIFHGSGKPFGFPEDCCVTFNDGHELSRKMNQITQDEYRKLRKCLNKYIQKTRYMSILSLSQLLARR